MSLRPAVLCLVLVALVGLLVAPDTKSQPGPPAAKSPLAAALRAGRYGEMESLHRRLAPTLHDPSQRSEADALLAQGRLFTGQYQEALNLLLAAVARDPKGTEARLQLGLAYRLLGQRDRERAVWNGFFDDHDSGALDTKDPAALRALAVAARHLGSYEDANDSFRDAVAAAKARKSDAEGVRANIEWAALFLEKYTAGHAEQSLDEALAKDPENPDARALLARVKLEQGNDVAGADKEIDRALLQNPRHEAALTVRAQIFLDNEQHDEAHKTIAALLLVNKESLIAHTLAAAEALLGDDTGRYEDEKRWVLSRDPHHTELHRTLADLLTTQHRYDEAVALLEEAVKLDPKDAYAWSALGSGYLRQGLDDKGLSALRRAWKGDRYNVRTHNLLDLFDKVIPGQYDVVTADIDRDTPGKGGLRLRLPKAERALLLPVLLPLIQDEWKELRRRYHFTPKLPLIVELYADPVNYAVRTVGLPGLAALGVTFGQVVTGRSPAQAAFNWGLMIWHELSHVFAIQISRSRVPRWFTEGLSEWETGHKDPDWTRRTHAELYAALRDDRLIPIADLNTGFTRARDVAHIVVAYHEAAAAMDFLVRRFGFDPIVKGLRLFGEGKRLPEVLLAITGMKPAALDAAFRADLSDRLAAYKGTFFLRPSDYSDGEELDAALKKRPQDGRLHALRAMLAVQQGDGQRAGAEVEAALKPKPPAKEALLASAELLLKKKDLPAAQARFRELIAAGGDGYDARERLGEIAAQRGELAEAEEQLRQAKKLDPDRAEPYEELAKLYTKMKREDDALKELEAAAHLDVMDAELVQVLVKRLLAGKRHAEAVEYGAMARFLSPYNVDLRAEIGEALLKLGRRSEAKAELSAALAALPEAGDEEEAGDLAKRRGELQALVDRANGQAPRPAPAGTKAPDKKSSVPGPDKKSSAAGPKGKG